MNSEGDIIWENMYGGNEGEFCFAIEQIEGDYIIVAYSGSSQNSDVSGINNGSLDFWRLKIDDSGEIEWDKLFGGDSIERIYSIQQTLDNGYIVAGTSLSSDSGDIVEIKNGSADIWILKLDPSGNLIWNTLLGGFNYEEGTQVHQISNSSYIDRIALLVSPANVNLITFKNRNYFFIVITFTFQVKKIAIYAVNRLLKIK